MITPECDMDVSTFFLMLLNGSLLAATLNKNKTLVNILKSGNNQMIEDAKESLNDKGRGTTIFVG